MKAALMPQISGSSPIWEGFGEFLRSPFVKTQRNHENSMKFPTRTQFFPSPKLNENTKTQFLDIFLANQSQKTLKKKAWLNPILFQDRVDFAYVTAEQNWSSPTQELILDTSI